MAWCLLIQYYSIYFYSLLLFFFPHILSYSTFIIILAGISSILMLAFLVRNRQTGMVFWMTAFTGATAVLLYLLNMRLGGKTDPQQTTFFLVLLGQTFPAALGSALVSAGSVKQKTVRRMLYTVSILFSFLTAMAVLFPNQYSGGGGLTTEFALNYQNGSYLCAYTSNCIMFQLITGRRKKGMRRTALVSCFLLNTFCLLVMGGKGGFVAYLFINGCLVLYSMKKRGMKPTVILRNASVAFVLMIIAFLIVQYARGFSLGGNVGFSRLAALFRSFDDSGRGAIYLESLRVFLSSPLLGRGLGSVFTSVGSHSHNLIIDCMAETGLVGLALLAGLLISSIRKSRQLIRMNESNWIVCIIFLQGLVISMFSGYYLAQGLLFSSMVLIQGRYQYERKQAQLPSILAESL